MHFFPRIARLLPLVLLLLLATGALLAGFLLGRRPRPAPRPGLAVSVLDVGQGEASWIRTPGGKFVLIGAGPPGSGPAVAEALRAAGARRIDLLVLPYPAAEAIGGIPEILRRFEVGAVLECGYPATEDLALQEKIRGLLGEAAVTVSPARAGQWLRLGGARLEVLAPADPPVEAPPRPANNSIVLRVVFGQTAFLWMGGVERAGENALLGRAPELSADWLRVSRFGSREATSPELLRLVRPSVAVVSVGVANRGGYPHRECLERLAAAGARVFRTDEAPARGGSGGELVFRSDGYQIEALP